MWRECDASNVKGTPEELAPLSGTILELYCPTDEHFLRSGQLRTTS
jgi:hypothetical protein